MKHAYRAVGMLLVLGGCAAQGATNDDMLGSAGEGFGNAAGQSAQASAGSIAPAGGSGGSTKPADPQTSSGGAAAQAGISGAGTGGKSVGDGMGTAGMGRAGMSGGGAVDSGVPQEEEFVPPDPALCADAVCFDVFDCYLWHIDSIDCGFTDCVDFICQ